ncbi:lactate utilization protein C [Canicola haemoglobinophilus]|uniref:Conserved iron-sulfur protein n=1 Tax=Canicola haemoglobinophilus TaxID=733 RepID=A0A1V4AZF9_9PAST|nr:lactate utilization protein C [Canicola haemoglobinophilus]OOR98522.1 lactate utilization protein C [Canicola haemoglobinophilus]STO54462.1 putative conserved iron-sulfur protein [Canicola haemoglobinophilus]STO60071.1 putative conserved iron-sulfur protein [Canicola haemoglobinophilus]STO68996.1 putative conserved iron-sulfur protein [Canicola haemoglobinophilus]
MDLQNRDNFLNKLAAKMGRPRQLVPEPMPELVNDYPMTRLTELSQTDLVDEFIRFAKVMMADVVETNEAELNRTLLDVCEKYGGGSIILNNDKRLVDLGVLQAIKEQYESYVWDLTQTEENFAQAEKANIGIVYGEYGLAESGGIVLFSDKDFGRSVSLLPEKSIVVLRKSTVLPRVAQLAKILHEKAQQGERMPSCVNIISGPSATADIELIKVVGVHGPVHKIYVVIDDL